MSRVGRRNEYDCLNIGLGWTMGGCGTGILPVTSTVCDRQAVCHTIEAVICIVEKQVIVSCMPNCDLSSRAVVHLNRCTKTYDA